MEYYPSRDNEKQISSNEPSSSHYSERNALKRTYLELGIPNYLKRRDRKRRTRLLNSACCNTQMYHSSETLSSTNDKIVQLEKDSKLNAIVAQALQCIMSDLGTIIKKHISVHGARKLAKRKLYDLIHMRILHMPNVNTVNSYKDIISQYGDEYPFSKDQDVLRIFEEGEEYSADVSLKSEDEINLNESILPQAGKICQIFETKLDKALADNMLGMIKNVVCYYQNERDILQCIDELPDMNDLSDKEEENSERIEETKDEVQMTNKGNEQGNQNQVSEADKRILGEYYKIIDNIMTPRIIKCLHKYKHEFEQALDNDEDYVKAKSKIISELRNKIEQSLNDMDDDVQIISVENDVISVDSDSDDEVMSKDRGKENIPETSKESQNKITKTDREFRDAEDKTNCVSDVSTKPEDVLFLAKVIGHPKLPPRSLLHKFLKKFNPALVRQHKTVHNLLVVGFKNKPDLYKIIEANKSIVGDSTITIILCNQKKIKNCKIDFNHDTRKNIVDEAAELTYENDAMDQNEMVIDDPKRTESNMELDETVVISDDDDDVELIEDDKVDTGEEKKEFTKAASSEVHFKLSTLLIGRPTLPDKAIVNEFLRGFNPVSIKRHKIFCNALFVSFNNKKDYDNIVAANESKVGSSIIVITPAVVNGPGKQDKASPHNDDSEEIIAEEINEKDGIMEDINAIEGNISAATNVFVEHNDSQNVLDTSKINGVMNTNMDDTKLDSSEQNDPSTLNGNKNDNIPNNLQETESLENSESIELMSKDENIDKEKQTKYKYEVRLLSLPKLPSIELLRAFFSKYNIKYKKKHKTHGNLLVIGLSDETQYHAILAMDGTSIGDVMFIIRPSV